MTAQPQSGLAPLPYGRQLLEEDDIAAVVDVLRGDWLTQGPRIEQFEQTLCGATGARHAIAVSSGTAALHIATKAAGVGRVVLIRISDKIHPWPMRANSCASSSAGPPTPIPCSIHGAITTSATGPRAGGCPGFAARTCKRTSRREAGPRG